MIKRLAVSSVGLVFAFAPAVAFAGGASDTGISFLIMRNIARFIGNIAGFH